MNFYSRLPTYYASYRPINPLSSCVLKHSLSKPSYVSSHCLVKAKTSLLCTPVFNTHKLLACIHPSIRWHSSLRVQSNRAMQSTDPEIILNQALKNSIDPLWKSIKPTSHELEGLIHRLNPNVIAKVLWDQFYQCCNCQDHLSGYFVLMLLKTAFNLQMTLPKPEECHSGKVVELMKAYLADIDLMATRHSARMIELLLYKRHFFSHCLLHYMPSSHFQSVTRALIDMPFSKWENKGQALIHFFGILNAREQLRLAKQLRQSSCDLSTSALGISLEIALQAEGPKEFSFHFHRIQQLVPAIDKDYYRIIFEQYFPSSY